MKRRFKLAGKLERTLGKLIGCCEKHSEDLETILSNHKLMLEKVIEGINGKKKLPEAQVSPQTV